MIQNDQLQRRQLAGFLSKRHMTSLHQIDNIKELRLRAAEIGKGALSGRGGRQDSGCPQPQRRGQKSPRTALQT